LQEKFFFTKILLLILFSFPRATEPATQPDEASVGAISLKLDTSGCIDVPKSLTLRPAMCGLVARGYSLFLFLFRPSS
jgi:hypothetical protein